MTIYKVDNLVVDGLVKEVDKDIVMVSVSVSSGECQLVKLLEEFLGHLASLMQKCQLILSVGFLIGVLEGFFTSSVESPKSAPIQYCSIDDLIDEIGGKLLRESSCEETRIESDAVVVI